MKQSMTYRFRPTVRMSDEEHDHLTRRAKEASLSLARYLVESGLRSIPPSREEQELKVQELLQREWAINQFARVGNNLNQAVKRLHTMTGTVSHSQLNQVLKDVSETLDSFRDTWRVPARNGGRGR